MNYKFVPMNQEFVDEVIGWHYGGIYGFYDMEADEEDLAEFIDPDNWVHKFAVLDIKDRLIGTYSYDFEDGIMWIGFGLRPDLTGIGMGENFVSQGIEFGIRHYNYTKDRVMLAVARFNKRAIRLYEKLGFEVIEEFMQKTNGGVYEFLKMQRLLR